MNNPLASLKGLERQLAMASSRMDFSEPDNAPADGLNRVIWHSVKATKRRTQRLRPPPVCRQLERQVHSALNSGNANRRETGPSRFASDVCLVAERAERHQEFTFGSQPIVDVTSVLAPASDE